MSKSGTKQIFAFWKEKEGKLFDVPFIYYHEKHAIEGVFSKKFWHLMIEKNSEN